MALAVASDFTAIPIWSTSCVIFYPFNPLMLSA
jgi:hypothetical protein